MIAAARAAVRRMIAWFRAEEIYHYRTANGSLRIKIQREIIGWSWILQSWDGQIQQSGNTFTNTDAFAAAARWAPRITLQIARGQIKVDASCIG